jgi:hypothetical protein
MPKETTTDSSEGGLVRLKYTFRFREKFDEPNDDWLKCIEAISDELLGAYSKAEDNALSAAFGGQGKKRLDRVFDAIDFVYPDYRYPLRGHEKKRKIASSVTPTEPVPKSKKVKILTHRPRYIEPAMIPEFGEGTSSAAETNEIVPTAQSTKEPTVMPKVLTVGLVETKIGRTEEPKIEEIMKMLEILSPPTEATLPKVQKACAATPKRRRMANVLDVVLETTKALSHVPTRKVAEAAKVQPGIDAKQAEVEAIKTQAETEAEPSTPAMMNPVARDEETTGQTAP